ncbi:hypothetical protein GCM10009127_14030 [Alteraurantiacibacter aestuarii]|uniref:Uncharacterized protein n=1 Tax=Alteraurantiacibacter aestuarii TaxID=650004 RepID=A0A844ZMD9_9SPHN|nr:hypothetical protein [Alteraurantiacibacter aestuarii]MXO88007.1 hypothetical protein [Alteraurantiacibacter aestuarii]
MIAFVGFMAAVMLVLLFAPASAAARLLHRQLVELPLERLARMERHHLIMLMIMVGFMIGGGEIMALMGPEIIATYALDLSIYLDLVMVSYAVSVARQTRTALAHLRGSFSRLLRRPEAGRRRRAVRKQDRSSPANDDETDPAFGNLRPHAMLMAA